MLVVSNTSPLLNLAIVHRLELLHQQFEAVLIPPAVREELQIDSELPGASEVRAALQSGWLREAGVYLDGRKRGPRQGGSSGFAASWRFGRVAADEA